MGTYSALVSALGTHCVHMHQLFYRLLVLRITVAGTSMIYGRCRVDIFTKNLCMRLHIALLALFQLFTCIHPEED